MTCSLSTSADGYIVGPDGAFDWSQPDEEAQPLDADERGSARSDRRVPRARLPRPRRRRHPVLPAAGTATALKRVGGRFLSCGVDFVNHCVLRRSVPQSESRHR